MGRGQGEPRQARTRAGTAWGRLTATIRPRPGGRSSHQVHRLQLGLALTVAALVLALAIAVPQMRRNDRPTAVAARAGAREATTSVPRRRSVPQGTGTSAPPTTATTTAPTTAAAASPASFTLAFAGDLLPHAKLTDAAAVLGRASGAPFDFRPMLAPLQPILRGVDLPICHMEVPVAPTPAQISSYPSFGAPSELVTGAASAGYRGCSTASNHSLDKGQAGIRATLDTFDLNRLGHAGTARTEAESQAPTFYDVRGVKVAHLSYAYGFNGYAPPPDKTWSVHQIDEARILADAKQARAAGAQLVVVSLHWGTEGQHAPNAQQDALAPRLAASPDIDLIIGHHAHVVQPIRRFAGKFVVFGLGNQLSNQTKDLQRDGLLVVATATRDAAGRYAVSALKAVPTWMDQSGWRVLPITATVADPATPPALASVLRASYARTVAAALDGTLVEGLTVEPLP